MRQFQRACGVQCLWVLGKRNRNQIYFRIPFGVAFRFPGRGWIVPVGGATPDRRNAIPGRGNATLGRGNATLGRGNATLGRGGVVFGDRQQYRGAEALAAVQGRVTHRRKQRRGRGRRRQDFIQPRFHATRNRLQPRGKKIGAHESDFPSSLKKSRKAPRSRI